MQVLDQFAWNQVAVSTLTRAILCLVFGLYLLRLRNKSAATKAATTFLLGLFVATLCCDAPGWLVGRANCTGCGVW